MPWAVPPNRPPRLPSLGSLATRSPEVGCVYSAPPAAPQPSTSRVEKGEVAAPLQQSRWPGSPGRALYTHGPQSCPIGPEPRTASNGDVAEDCGDRPRTESGRGAPLCESGLGQSTEAGSRRRAGRGERNEETSERRTLAETTSQDPGGNAACRVPQSHGPGSICSGRRASQGTTFPPQWCFDGLSATWRAPGLLLVFLRFFAMAPDIPIPPLRQKGRRVGILGGRQKSLLLLLPPSGFRLLRVTRRPPTFATRKE